MINGIIFMVSIINLKQWLMYELLLAYFNEGLRHIFCHSG